MNRFLGRLDFAGPKQLRGWAKLEGSEDPVVVRVSINGALKADVTADYFRADVKALNLSKTGHCGFVLNFNENEALGPSDIVSVRPIGADKDLAGSPYLIKVDLASSTTQRIESSTTPTKQSQYAADELTDSSNAAGYAPLPMVPPPINRPRSSFEIFRSSFMALFLRDVKQRFGTHKYSYFWVFAEPIMYMAMLQAVRSIFGRSKLGTLIHGVDAIFFMGLGVVPFFLFSRSYNNALGAMSSAKSLFNYRQIKPIDSLLVKVLIESSIMVLTFIIVWSAMWWVGLKIEMNEPLGFILAVTLLFLLAIGFGLFADVYITRNSETRRIAALFDRPLLFISGVFYTMQDLPESLLRYFWWNPIFHAIDLARGAALTDYDSPASWPYLFSATSFMLLLGLASYRQNLFRLTQQ